MDRKGGKSLNLTKHLIVKLNQNYKMKNKLKLSGGEITSTFQTSESSVYSFFKSKHLQVDDIEFNLHMYVQKRALEHCNVLINNQSFNCQLTSVENYRLFACNENFKIIGNEFTGFWVESLFGDFSTRTKFVSIENAVQFFKEQVLLMRLN